MLQKAKLCLKWNICANVTIAIIIAFCSHTTYCWQSMLQMDWQINPTEVIMGKERFYCCEFTLSSRPSCWKFHIVLRRGNVLKCMLRILMQSITWLICAAAACCCQLYLLIENKESWLTRRCSTLGNHSGRETLFFSAEICSIHQWKFIQKSYFSVSRN